VLIIPSSWGFQLDGDIHHQHRSASDAIVGEDEVAKEYATIEEAEIAEEYAVAGEDAVAGAHASTTCNY
jgi:hypothetical protein